MTRPLLCLPVALAACSSEPQRNASAPAPAPFAAPAAPAPAASPVASARDSGVTPRPSELKTFGDWTVGCDNTGRCEMRSLAADGAEPSVTVSIARDAGPAGKVELTLDGHEDSELGTAVDGRLTGSPLATLAAMANGKALAARVGARTVATLSLKGASAALRYMDATQGRAGTVTALVAKGLKPVSAVPAPTPAPVILALAPTGDAATPPTGALAAMRKAATCDDQPDKPEFHALGRGKTLVLLPCSSGAYNVLQALFVWDGSRFVPADADAPVGFAETGADDRSPATTVVNGEWKDGVLASYAKGRGIGDCGSMQELVWDGNRLRLSRQRDMGECRGNPDYITTWRANVVRR